ncbi:MAG TPA: DUF1761 domain-containing protein [Pyrinomonadaceae bacterium]|nr:DUF1761 domain-containing protein [Pyrinomonadaceae bacterium]
MITRVAIAALVGSVVMFGLGFLIYGVLLDSYMRGSMTPEAAKTMKEMPNLFGLFVSNLAFSWMYAFVFERWAGIKTFVSGLIAGILIVVPIAIGFDLNMFSTMNLTSGFTPIIVDVLAVTVLSAISAGVIGQVLGMLNKNKASD